MALETIIHNEKQISNQNEDAQKIPELEKSENGNGAKMITVDKSAAEKFMLAIEQCVGDIAEQKQLVDKLIESKNKELESFKSDTIVKFNAMIDATQGLKEKISAAESYENYLEEQVKNANLSKEVAMLEQQLQKEKTEISLFIRDVTNTVNLKLSEIEAAVQNLKSADETIEQNLAKFKDEMAKETENYEKSAESKLDETGSHLQKISKSLFEGLKADSDNLLKSYTSKCQEHLETVKKQSIDFLKQCEAENKKLIEKVPAVASKKISKKDIIIYALAFTSIASLAVQMFV